MKSTIKVARASGGYATIKVPAYLLRAKETVKAIEAGRIGGAPHLEKRDLMLLEGLQRTKPVKRRTVVTKHV